MKINQSQILRNIQRIFKEAYSYSDSNIPKENLEES